MNAHHGLYYWPSGLLAAASLATAAFLTAALLATAAAAASLATASLAAAAAATTLHGQENGVGMVHEETLNPKPLSACEGVKVGMPPVPPFQNSTTLP